MLSAPDTLAHHPQLSRQQEHIPRAVSPLQPMGFLQRSKETFFCQPPTRSPATATDKPPYFQVTTTCK